MPAAKLGRIDGDCTGTMNVLLGKRIGSWFESRWTDSKFPNCEVQGFSQHVLDWITRECVEQVWATSESFFSPPDSPQSFAGSAMI
jgi:hypothetical protein